MKIKFSLLRQLIAEVIGKWDFKGDVAAAHAEEEALKRAEDKAYAKLKSNPISTGQVSEKGFEGEIEELQSYPEYESIETFIEAKMDEMDAQKTLFFSAADMHALARNIYHVEAAGVTQLRAIKQELIDFGLVFQPREPLKADRGFKSSAHGTHPFANSGGGGSGFSSGGLGMGGGPGAMGGGTFSSRDPRSLPMGAGRKK